MFEALADYLRLARAGLAMARHDVVIPAVYRRRAPWPARLAGPLLRALPGGGARGQRPGQRFARALEKLGPAWIKLGQFLATRPDVIGVSAAQDLSRLKDALPAFSAAQAVRALREEFGAEAGDLFRGLGPAVAAASVAQVHRLTTPEGERAVKILRPGVEQTIERELRAMQRAARLAQSRGDAEIRRLEPKAFVGTLARSMRRELDLRLEAAAAHEFAEIAAVDGYLAAPGVDWERTSRRVLTMEWISGLSLTHPAALADRAGRAVDRADLANRVTRGFLASALDHGFFHADLHEGNMILADDGRLVLVDFGIMGRIGHAERRFLAEIIAGFLARDYARVSRVHFDAGYVPREHTVEEFAQALRSVGEPIFGKDASSLAMSRVLLQLFDITREFGMHLRPELILLQKTMVQVEGVARTIDPSHDIWRAARPVVERWSRREFGPEGARRIALEAAGETFRRLRSLPATLDLLNSALIEQARPRPAPPRPPSRLAWLLLGAAAGVVLLGGALIGLDAAGVDLDPGFRRD